MFPKDLKVVKDESDHVWLTNQEETLAYAKLMVPSENNKDDVHNLLLKLPEVFNVLENIVEGVDVVGVPSEVSTKHVKEVIKGVLSK